MNFFNSFFKRNKYILPISIVLLILILLTTLISVFKNDKSDTEIDVIFDESVNSSNLLSGDSNFLVICNDEKIGDAVFMSVVNFKIFTSEIVISILDQNTLSNEKTYAQIYSYGGINDLMYAVESVRKCKIDRYVVIDKDGFSKITDIMGKVSLDVSESYTYESSEHSYFVEKGENDLEGAMLYSYLKLLSYKPDSQQLIADVLCNAINQYMSDINADNTLNLFENISNCFKSNLTIADYYSCESDIKHLLTHDTECIIFSEGD